ncbi:response regulator [Thalassotalea montiporae]
MTKFGEQVTLLVVEDDDIDFMTIERSFARERIGNKIIRAHHGEEALSLLLNDAVPHPFVVLLDLQMPKMGGLEFLAQVRSNENTANAIIFVLTTSDDEQDIVSSYSQNVAGYFVKDEAGKEFVEIVSLLQGYWRIAHLPV